MSFLSKIFGDPNARAVKVLQPLVDATNAAAAGTEALSDEALRVLSTAWKARCQSGESLDALVPEIFAAVREAARRRIGQRHFDVQLLGGFVLYRGGIAEMRTGEGKTLTATLAASAHAMTGKGVHVVTVNDYLAKRDAAWMGRVYDALGLSVGVIQHSAAFRFDPNAREHGFLVPVARREAYTADITYGTNNEFGFDYLRDNMVMRTSDMVQRAFAYAIVDEVDSILIDEARTPLIISAPARESSSQYAQFANIVRALVANEDYNIDEKMRSATLTEQGIAKVEKLLNVENLYAQGGMTLVHHIEQALRAEALYKIDRDYVVREGEVVIVDEFTGRLMVGRRYSEGLHQAIEAKEGVHVQRESDTLATVTFQNYFRLYSILSGMTGTAASEAEEFHKIYKLDVTVIPTHRPMVRRDLVDRIYKTEDAKLKAVAAEVRVLHEQQQPVLVGTISIEKNEQLSTHLTAAGVPHALLNAKNHENEAKILADAGRLGAVTVATNMAGRGVDIILGGAPPDPGQAIEGKGRTMEEWRQEHEAIVAKGGLFVIGTERHESRRIDNQLRGRAGRQGDPGVSQFYVSLDDDLMRIFASPRMKSMMDKLGMPDDMPIEHRLVSRGLESAQGKVESHHFDTRKHLLEYDDVLNKHRETIYKRRRDILSWTDGDDANRAQQVRSGILAFIAEEIETVVGFHTGSEKEWNVKEICEVVRTIFTAAPTLESELAALVQGNGTGGVDGAQARSAIMDRILAATNAEYDALATRLGNDTMLAGVLQGLALRALDTIWVEHLDAMERLRQGIGLRGYGQRDPLVEYKHESFRMFQSLLDAIRQEIVYAVFKVTAALEAHSLLDRRGVVVTAPEKGSAGGPLSFEERAGVRSDTKVGRNDPCHCGSGKKWKKCHGG